MSSFTSRSDAAAKRAYVDPTTRVDQVKFYKAPILNIDSLEEEDFHIITSDAKKVIFDKHLATQDASEKKGQEILARLAKLAPSIAEHFEVKINQIEKMTFRLWAQRETDEMREDSYVALSYCWGSSRQPTRPNVKYPLPIPPIMFSALASERQWRSTGVWIDQLCIDQTDKVEKSVSVGAMDYVYRSAQFVIVALLDIEVPLEQQFFLQTFIPDYESASNEKGSTPHSGESPPFFEKNPEFRRLLYTVLRSRWFTRAWCSHEMELGENFVFYVPCASTNSNPQMGEMLAFSSTFLWDMLVLSAEVPGTDGPSRELRSRLFKVFNMRSRIARVYQYVTGKSDRSLDESLVPSYAAQIRDIFDLGAGGDPDLSTDLRAVSAHLDKSSIVLNTLSNGLAMGRTLDAKLTEDECMRRLLLLGLAANDPTVLCTLGPPLGRPSSPLSPSWLCRPGAEDLGTGSLRHTYLPGMLNTDNIRLDSDLEWIALDMLALGKPSPPSEKYRELASGLIQKAAEIGMGHGPAGDEAGEFAGKTDVESQLMAGLLRAHSRWGAGPQYQYWQQHTVTAASRERFVWTVACLLQCGPRWMLGMTQRGGHPGASVLAERIGTFFSSPDAGLDPDGGWADSQMGRDAVDAILGAANWLLMRGLTLPYPDDSGDFMPLLFDHGSGRASGDGSGKGRALVFAPTDALVQVAMPVGLLPDHYASLHRLWLLQATDDPFYDKMMAGQPARWFVRAKMRLFTDVDAAETVVSGGSAGDGQPGWRWRPGVVVHGPPPS